MIADTTDTPAGADAVVVRPARCPDDAPALADAILRNRAHMRPWEPHRPEEFYTAEAQVRRLEEPGTRHVVAVEGDRVVGGARLSGTVLGPFRTTSLGYWVDPAVGGRGVATRMVAECRRIAVEELGLHRIEASTILDNTASQRVLAKSGFERIGTAPRYLHIDGAWRDHHLFQLILHDNPPPLR
ncbi:GNAT family protein [Streptomyces sp. NPDC001941]|uniref:GNAT family N-acetyltransferase n=1 Tax=Streptomyces sp. NPDC001941 TaxID=3154659 RepID=UPI00331989B0